MRQCLKEISGRIEFVAEYKGKTAKDVRERMDQVMASRGEGLIIKHPSSKYVLNGRNMDWIKVSLTCYYAFEAFIIYFSCPGQARVYGMFYVSFKADRLKPAVG